MNTSVCDDTLKKTNKLYIPEESGAWCLEQSYGLSIYQNICVILASRTGHMRHLKLKLRVFGRNRESVTQVQIGEKKIERLSIHLFSSSTVLVWTLMWFT